MTILWDWVGVLSNCTPGRFFYCFEDAIASLLVITSLHRKLGQNSFPKTALPASSFGDLWARMEEQV